MSLPEHVGVDEGLMHLGLKLRMALEYTGGQHIRIHEFEAEVKKFRSIEDTQLLRTFPFPTILDQSPHLPLLNATHMESLDGFLLVDSHQRKGTRRCPMVPEKRIYDRPSVGGVNLDRRWVRMDGQSCYSTFFILSFSRWV